MIADYLDIWYFDCAQYENLVFGIFLFGGLYLVLEIWNFKS